MIQPASFEILFEGIVIGQTTFEHADAPMNVVFGELRTTADFERVRGLIRTAQGDVGVPGIRIVSAEQEVAQKALAATLSARATDGTPLSPCVGIAIEDWTTVDAHGGIRVSILGLDGSLYEKYFGHHSRDYDPSWRSDPPADRIRINEAGITTVACGALVNAANSALTGGGGVDGAIHRAAGPRLAEDCRHMDSCPVGSAVVTRGYELPSQFVIHAVGPAWSGGENNEQDLLRSCIQSSLQRAEECNVRSVAFPAISCGAHRFPVDLAARIAIGECLAFLAHSQVVTEIQFCLPEDKVRRAFQQELRKHEESC